MTEKQYKEICKFAIEHGTHPLTDREKEIIKQAIDKAKTINDFFAIIEAVIKTTENR